MSDFFHAEDGYYTLTSAGTFVFIIFIAVLVALTAFLKPRKAAGGGQKLFSTRQLVFSAAALALAFATSYIKLLPMPWGGSVTLCSMLFVTITGWWYGPKIGFTAAFAYGLLQFIQDGGSYILSPMQACMDYILAFAALGVSGFFYKKKNGLLIGYWAAILFRGVFHSIGGYLYWMDYMPENFPKSLASIYPIAYNYSYILTEAVITTIILVIPAVKKVMIQGRKLADE